MPKTARNTKEGSYLVNTACGGIVDLAALVEALESGRLKRAGLVALPIEPDIDAWVRESEKVGAAATWCAARQ